MDAPGPGEDNPNIKDTDKSFNIAKDLQNSNSTYIDQKTRNNFVDVKTTTRATGLEVKKFTSSGANSKIFVQRNLT